MPKSTTASETLNTQVQAVKARIVAVEEAVLNLEVAAAAYGDRLTLAVIDINTVLNAGVKATALVTDRTNKDTVARYGIAGSILALPGGDKVTDDDGRHPGPVALAAVIRGVKAGVGLPTMRTLITLAADADMAINAIDAAAKDAKKTKKTPPPVDGEGDEVDGEVDGKGGKTVASLLKAASGPINKAGEMAKTGPVTDDDRAAAKALMAVLAAIAGPVTA